MAPSTIHPLDAELFDLIDEHEAEKNLTYRYPTSRPAGPGPDLTPEEDALYRAVFGDERTDA